MVHLPDQKTTVAVIVNENRSDCNEYIVKQLVKTAADHIKHSAKMK